MISDTLSGLVSAAGFNQPRCTSNRRHVSRESGSSLWIVLVLCCITVICGDAKNRLPRGFKDLQAALMSPPKSKLGYCDLETSCDWSWNQTLSFTRVTASAHALRDYEFGPNTDASKSINGHYLWFTGHGEAQIWSKSIPRTRPHCGLEFWLHQVEMRDGIISLVIQYNNNMSSVAENKNGNNHAIWEKIRFNLGAISQPYRLFLEFLLPYTNSSIALDNIRLVNCFPESEVVCTEDMFWCDNGSCLDRSRVCDLTKDCPNGEDEAAECDKIPENTRCNFEDGWCGWENTSGRPMNWTLHHGSTPAQRIRPFYDHTYRNRTGTYAYIDMTQHSSQPGKSPSEKYGNRGTIESPLYNPTPPYSSNPKSPYYQSCQVRFFYQKFGLQTRLPFSLYLVQIKPHGNHSIELWQIPNRKADVWLNEAVPLPDVRYRYFLQFEATRAYSPKIGIAIDDISLSPECFAIDVPPEVVGNFNYHNPIIDYGRIPVQHPSFENKTDPVIRINTCKAIGRTGPTTEQCAQENNRTNLYNDIDLSISKQNNTLISYMNGIQRWTAPRGEYYTLIGVGARGGMGSGELGSSQGALVRGIIELQKGDQLYFMIGQAGVDACPKNLGMKIDSCQSLNQSHRLSKLPDTASKIRAIKKIEFQDGGGGGGGATSIFIIKANGEWEPILIAAGGGGLGLGRFTDDGLQHGRGPMPAGRPPPPTSEVSKKRGGSGANWAGTRNNGSGQNSVAGIPLIHGGLGGVGCGTENKTHGNGGFGGGGGGCLTGGGGGGYIGGATGYKEFGNGEGGYSYASQRLTDIYFRAGAHYGPGEVLIIPAISGCNCDYRCVALDQYLSETKCLCPQGWILSNNSISCVMADDSRSVHQTYIIPLIIVSIGLFTIAGICLIFYKRYQNQKALLHRRQVMFGNGTELTALRNISDTMMTEFNPNYEFAGNLYSFKDLPQIPRDYISLVKPLGQGAFGEVFQGVCKYGCGEEHPVAVKALPSLSTTQAETDFMMEALIMSKFNHPNIVHFIGVSFEKHPRYIVLELLAGGDLKNFLREERPRSDRSTSLSMLDLIMCGYDVANGCKYMEEARFIHRDIAARNCLLTDKGPGRIVKIADFGMARDIYRSDYYRKGGKAMLPIKWMPPESFLDGIFTTKTDVWAFGVLLWEIMSFGYIPYTGCTNREVMSMVTSGGRLEKPAGCPDPIYGIMTRCWHPQPDDRPSFSTIAERIGYCLQDPDVINHPTPNFDILPICDREITIMRPDPEADCINVQSDLDVCGYVQPKIIDHRSVARHVGQIIGTTIYSPENEKLNTEPRGSNFARSPESRPKAFHYKLYDSNTKTVERTYSGDKDHKDDYHDNMSADCKDRHRINRSNRQDRRVHKMPNNIKDCDDLRDSDNGNSGIEECHSNTDIDNAITDRRNGNESATTTDTDSLIAQSSDTPPDTTTNSSSNTRMGSPNRTAGFNANVNGMVKKSTLKATLSLDPSTLCRNTIPYEKISTQTQQPSTPGSIELRKDSRNQPREEECSC